MLASFGSLVLSYVTTASGGAASPGLGGQGTPRGKGKGKDRTLFPKSGVSFQKVTFFTTSGMTRTSETGRRRVFFAKKLLFYDLWADADR